MDYSFLWVTLQLKTICPQDSDEEIIQDSDEEITQDSVEEITQDSDEEITQDSVEEITQDSVEEITQDSDEEITQDSVEEITQDSDEEIKKVLENIPDDLDSTYERILDKIDTKSSPQREQALKAFLFIAYAREPVSIDVLALALAVQDDKQDLDSLRSLDLTGEKILSACDGLLSIDNTDSDIRRVRFIHSSVREYLIDHPRHLRPGYEHSKIAEDAQREIAEYAHREIARMCIVFLLILYSLGDFCTHAESTFANNYIVPSLPYHLLHGNLESLPPADKMVDLISRFFERGAPMLAPNDGSHPTIRTFFTFSPSVLALIFNLPGKYQCYDPHGLHRYGKQLEQNLLTWIYGRVNHPDTHFEQVLDNRFAMHYAIGQLDSVSAGERLCTHQYPTEHHHSDGPFNMDQIPEKAKWIPSFCVLTPLYLAKSREAAEFLLNKGVKVGLHVRTKLPNLLEQLARGGEKRVIIQLLLERGANQDIQSSALQSLATGGEVEAIRLLLDCGVDVNVRGGQFDSVLLAAAYCGHTEIVELCLSKGADVNAQAEEHGNALQAAAYGGHVEVLEVLLKNQANHNAHGGQYGNPLQAAAYGGHVEAIRVLLNKGVDVNVQGGKYGNPLQAATYRGRAEAIQLLLDKGAHVDAQGGEYGTALQAALAPTGSRFYDHLKNALYTAEILLDRGAVPTVIVTDSTYKDALSAAKELWKNDETNLARFMKLLELHS